MSTFVNVRSFEYRYCNIKLLVIPASGHVVAYLFVQNISLYTLLTTTFKDLHIEII